MIWTGTQSQVSAAIKKLGFVATLVKVDGTKAKAYGVWDVSIKENRDNVSSRATSNQKQLYLQASIKKEPKVGDTVEQGEDVFSIVEVEAYRPATAVLAYRVVVI